MTNGSNALAVSAAKLKGQIVTQTLDTLNSSTYAGGKKKSKYAGSAMSDTYNLSKSVLSAAYEGKGIGINTQS